VDGMSVGNTRTLTNLYLEQDFARPVKSLISTIQLAPCERAPSASRRVPLATHAKHLVPASKCAALHNHNVPVVWHPSWTLWYVYFSLPSTCMHTQGRATPCTPTQPNTCVQPSTCTPAVGAVAGQYMCCQAQNQPGLFRQCASGRQPMPIGNPQLCSLGSFGKLYK
jgi:hypothetical protein